MSDAVERATVREGAATVERTVERKERGVTAEYTLSTDADGPLGVRVEQAFTGDPIEEIGFHPDYTPRHWDADETSVTFEVVVRPGKQTEAVLGLVTEDPHDGLLAGEPRVLRAEHVDPSAVDADADTVFVRRPRPAENDGFFAGVKRIVLGSSGEGDGREESAGRDGTDVTVEDDSTGTTVDAEADDGAVTFDTERQGTDVTATDDATDATDVVIDEAEPDAKSEGVIDLADAEAAAEAAGEAEPAEPDLVDAVERVDAADHADPAPTAEAADEGPSEGESESEEAAPEATEDVTTDEDATTDDTEPPVETADAADGGDGERDVDGETAPSPEAGNAVAESADATDADPEPADADPDGSLVERLVAELEAGEADEDELAALRAALDVDSGSADESEDAAEADVGESVTVRLRHVQSRMEDFAAYADVLEEVIDEHGADFLADTEERLDDHETELAAVRSAAEEARDERAALSEDVADLREELSAAREEAAAVREDVDDLREDLDDLREAHETRVRRLEDDVDMLASDAREARADLREDVSTLRREVRDLKQMRDALSSAFGGAGDDL